MRAIAGAALASIVLAGAAQAQDALETYPQRSFGPWSVYGFQGDCWMVNDDVSGASVSLSTNAGDTDLYIAAQHPGWSDIAENAQLEVRLSFAGFDAVRAANGLPVRGRGFSLFLDGARDSHLGALQASPQLRLAFSGVALDVPLADTGPAFDYMRRCTARIRG